MDAACSSFPGARSLIRLGLVLAAGGAVLVAAPAPVVPVNPAAASPPAAALPDALTWDSESKELVAKPGQETASFFFCVTNTSSADVVIDRMGTSCGCTVATMPSQPWVIHPQAGGKIDVTVDLRNKTSPVVKYITPYRTNNPVPRNLIVTVIIPQSPELLRMQNQGVAQADRQAVFKNDCARCHAEPAHGKSGQELFAAACGICHESDHRAAMVPDLHALKHDSDRVYWKQWITTGRPGSLMPGFAREQGGPLTPAQIESLADYLDQAIPHTARPKPAAQVNASLPPAIPAK
jgi:cytochrome c553